MIKKSLSILLIGYSLFAANDTTYNANVDILNSSNNALSINNKYLNINMDSNGTSGSYQDNFLKLFYLDTKTNKQISIDKSKILQNMDMRFGVVALGKDCINKSQTRQQVIDCINETNRKLLGTMILLNQSNL